MTQENNKNLNFEDAMSELETIVNNLETGQTSLEESVKAYERGMELRTICEKRLRDATLKIEKVTKVNDDGSVETTELDPQSLNDINVGQKI